jgi:acyl-CoA synthetase (NDP forming)
VGVINAVEADENIGGIIFGVNISVTPKGGPPKAITDAVLEARAGGCKKPVFLVSSQEATKGTEIRNAMEAAGVVLTSCGETGYTVLGKLAKFLEYNPEESSLTFAVPDAPLSDEKVALSEFDSKTEMAEFGLPIPKQAVVRSAEELGAVLADMKLPVVLKINSQDILHKTDAGGVKLGIDSVEAAEVAYGEILESCKAYDPNARLDGILVQEMAPKGTEIIIGVNSDKQFGPVLMVGLGGVFVEVFKDVALCPCPVTLAEAKNLLAKLKSYKLLTGYRGSLPADVDALAEVIVKVSDYATENKNELKELDLNPVFVYPKGEGVSVVDALVVKAAK